MTDIYFEKFDGLVKAWIKGERPDFEDLRFNGWNVEAMVRFMLDISLESYDIDDDCDIIEDGDISF